MKCAPSDFVLPLRKGDLHEGNPAKIAFAQRNSTSSSRFALSSTSSSFSPSSSAATLDCRSAAAPWDWDNCESGVGRGTLDEGGWERRGMAQLPVPARRRKRRARDDEKR